MSMLNKTHETVYLLEGVYIAPHDFLFPKRAFIESIMGRKYSPLTCEIC